MNKIEALKEYIEKELGWCYQNWWELETYWFYLESLKEQDVEEEMNQRDNDLCNIHNSDLDRGDMYMEIIGYLVDKWFLQDGQPS